MTRLTGLNKFALAAACWAACGTMAVAQAQDYAAEIMRLCTTERNRASVGTLGERIDVFFSRYTETTLPVQLDHDRIMREIDGIIAETSFADILECPARVEELGLAFNINTEHESDTWHVMTIDDSMTLNINARRMARSPSVWIPIYLHEMLHVCQEAEKPQIKLREAFDQIEQDPVASEEMLAFARKADAFGGMLLELEAFLLETEGYRELVRASPRMCGADYPYQAEFEDHLSSGTFAQVNMYAYLDDSRYAGQLDWLVDLSEPAISYLYDGAVVLEVQPLQDDFREAVIALGIPVNDGRRDIRPNQLPFEIQVLLRKAGCYDGALDNIWGPASRRALSDFADQAGARFDSLEPEPETYLAVLDLSEASAARCR